MSKRALILAPHPDDEVLGVGGTIAKWAGTGEFEVHVAIMTVGGPPLFEQADVERVRTEAEQANEVLGVTAVHFAGLPAAELDSVPHHELNAAISSIVGAVSPSVVFVPFLGDVHLDHPHGFQSAMVALRPAPGAEIESIYAYETVSETNWNAPFVTPAFVPNTYIDISGWLDIKLAAMSAYQSQLREFPDERSLQALRALAEHRGSTVGVPAAEAFVQIRRIIR